LTSTGSSSPPSVRPIVREDGAPTAPPAAPGAIRARADVDAFLAHLTLFGTKLGLDTPRRLLAALGDPQNAYPSVHVAGTNGKGSTCVLLEAILRAAGRTVGRYTSPHLEDFSERIAVNGRPIQDADLVRCAARVHGAAAGLEAPPTFFEAATAIAFLHLAEAGPDGAPVDAAVVEVGLGGRLDATNVLTPEVCVITNVDLDHTKHLGATVAAVAGEKAGIIKPGVPVVTGTRGEALDVVRATAARTGAPLLVLGEDFAVTAGTPFTYDGPGGRREGLTLGLAGVHQRDNAALALAAAARFLPDGLPDAGALRRALAEARWPGRLEPVAAAAPVLLDCAHNGPAARALADHLARDSGGPLWLVLGVLADKDFDAVATALCPLAARVFVTAPDTPRRADPAEQARIARRHARDVTTVPGVAAAVDLAVGEAAAAGGRVVVTGSIYTVGEARSHLRVARAAA
jgi:dihydrofolate synthase/folylpolyglutamate synthase